MFVCALDLYDIIDFPNIVYSVSSIFNSLTKGILSILTQKRVHNLLGTSACLIFLLFLVYVLIFNQNSSIIVACSGTEVLYIFKIKY
jgi:hypothetical protein